MTAIRDGFLARAGLLTAPQIAAAADLVAQVAADRLETVRVVFADAHGILRGKTVVADALEPAFSAGVRVPSTLLLKDVSHRTVFPVWSDSGDSPMQGAGDVLLVPDPASFRVLPWSPHSAMIHCELARTDGEPLALSSRQVLSRAVDRLAARGLAALTGLEVEFQVFEIPAPADGDAPAPRALNPGYRYLTETRYAEAEALLDRLRRAAQGLGLPVRSVEIEMGPGQFEFTFAPADPLAIAEMAVTFRTMVKEVCHREGLLASFMARPQLPNAVGNGWHIHQSLTDVDGRNLFVPDVAETLTAPAGAWLAGLLCHAGASCLATTPTVNGYKRYTPYQLAPNRVGWGWDNRGAMLRVLAAPGDPASRIENRVPDSTANPYLALAFQIHAGLDGLESGLAAPPPLDSPYDAGGTPLPRSLGEAIDVFAESGMYRTALGAEVADYLIRLKRAEWDRYQSTVTDWEQREYFDTF